MEDHLVCENVACAKCNVSMPEIEPRMFSFNAPEGACPVCSGLGSKLVVKTELLFAESFTLDEGGIIPLAAQFETNTWMAKLIRQVALENGFDSKTAIKDLKDEQREILLYGTGKREYAVKGLTLKEERQLGILVLPALFPSWREDIRRVALSMSRQSLRSTWLKRSVLSVMVTD